MGDVKQAHSELVQGHPGLTSKNLSRAIFQADVPEQYVRTLPAQSLFMAIKHNGLGSSTDLIEIATVDQCRLMLDFDLWDRDHINEENLWEWLSLSDEQNDLELLQKLLKAIDLKLIALMISRYVDVVVLEDPSDQPPSEGYHTPDKGYTWLGIDTEDSTKHFLLARLLALVFETSAELFYQLIAIKNVSTPAMLEEESYTERTRRLASEGIPPPEEAYSMNSPLEPVKALELLKRVDTRPAVEDIAIVEPLVYDGGALQPLMSLLSQISPVEQFEGELTLIMNSAITYWAVEFHQHDEIARLVARVKGALNIGLEIAMKESGKLPIEIYRAMGLQPLYRMGLFRLHTIRKAAIDIPDAMLATLDPSSPAFSVVAGLRLRFPEMPVFFESGRDLDEGLEKEGGYTAIQTLGQLERLRRFLDDQIPRPR